MQFEICNDCSVRSVEGESGESGGCNWDQNSDPCMQFPCQMTVSAAVLQMIDKWQYPCSKMLQNEVSHDTWYLLAKLNAHLLAAKKWMSVAGWIFYLFSLSFIAPEPPMQYLGLGLLQVRITDYTVQTKINCLNSTPTFVVLGRVKSIHYAMSKNN